MTVHEMMLYGIPVDGQITAIYTLCDDMCLPYRARKCTHGKHLRELVLHLSKQR